MTTTATISNIVGIRFQKLGKMYHFKVSAEQKIEAADYVVVETKRGRQLGQVIAYIEPDKITSRTKIRGVKRKANPRDLVMKQVWDSKNLDALITCREQAHNLKIRDVKFIQANYSFDGSWMTILYTTEERPNLNELRAQLGRMFRTRVEMQLIGPRDVARILGGYGACGGPRCCSTFLTEFSPVSIRMAKAQGISLSPTEITGMCGRLRCCLVYEYEQYVEARKKLPRVKKKVITPYGEGIVRDVLALKDAVLVQFKNGDRREVSRHELEPLAELRALEEKAAKGCSKHEGGGCECGADRNTDSKNK